MKAQLTHTLAHVRQYRFADGTYELFLGCLLAWGAISLLITHSVIPVLLLFVTGLLVVGKIIQEIQHRYVFPRSGYVQYPEEAPSQRWQTWLATLLACLFFGTLFGLVLLTDREHAYAWVMPIMAIMIGGILAMFGIYYHTLRLGILSILSILTSLGLSPLFLEYETTRRYLGLGTFPVYCLALGLLLIISGGWRLTNLIGTTPPKRGDQDE